MSIVSPKQTILTARPASWPDELSLVMIWPPRVLFFGHSLSRAGPSL